MRGFSALPRAILAAVLFCASLLAYGAEGAAEEVAVPPLKARVTDLTGTLDGGQRAALEAKLAAFEQKKGSQIAVLLVPTTQPETVEQFGIRVAEQWKIGRKGVDDGVLLLIAKNDRKLRIEVGRGLEGALPDAIAKRIIAEDIAPLFKQGDFNGGINAGVDRIIKVVDGEPLPEAKGKGSGASSGFKVDDVFTWGAILVVFLGGILRSIFGVVLGAVIAGVLAGVAAALLGGGVIGGAIVGVIVFVFCLVGITVLGAMGGGGGSSGGWSGGGGDFGGGGASGSW